MARMVSLLRDNFMGGQDVDAGMCLALSDDTLEKLGVDDDVEVGDMLHMFIMVEATSVHKDGQGTRIEARIIAGHVEDENTEGPDDDDEEDE